jgi:hypothetical protein
VRLAGVLVVLALSGCRCDRNTDAPAAPLPSASTSAAPTFDLVLHRAALMAFGSSIPLPLSQNFDEEVPDVRPALERSAKAHPNEPLPLRVARDVPYGQLTRLVQAAIAYRVTSWALFSEDSNATMRSFVVSAPGALPSGRCFARLWVAGDAVVHVGIDPGNEGGTMSGVVVRPRDGAVQAQKALDVVRRLDSSCKEGQLRLYTQPTASFGPIFDLGIAAAAAPPRVGNLMLGVPSLGPLDTPVEIVP